MSLIKYRYSISILLGLLGILSFFIITTPPNINSFLLELILGFIIISLLSYGYKMIKHYYEEDIASKIIKGTQLLGVFIIIITSVINYFLNPILTAVIGSILSLTLVSYIQRSF